MRTYVSSLAQEGDVRFGYIRSVSNFTFFYFPFSSFFKNIFIIFSGHDSGAEDTSSGKRARTAAYPTVYVSGIAIHTTEVQIYELFKA